MIAVDAMGGDHAPEAIVHGAVAAARSGIPILLVGKKEALTSHLPVDWKTLPIKLEFCTDHILMGEDPGRSVRTKPESSLVKAMKAVSQGRASAFFSAGNSGAVMIGSVLFIGRIRGVHRPAVGAFLPTKKGSVFCLDVGANVDCKAQYLYQFALMGHAYLQVTKGLKQPRIGLLSNGQEPYKGPQEIKKAYELLSRCPLNFIGNIEARQVSEGIVSRVVCDGFVGNVLLKTMQGIAQAMFSWIKEEAAHSWVRRGLLWLNRGIFKDIKKRMDYASVGGALMLGINQPVILAHGRSHARAIENALLFAQQVVEQRRVYLFNDRLRALLKKRSRISSVVLPKVRSLFAWKQK